MFMSTTKQQDSLLSKYSFPSFDVRRQMSLAAAHDDWGERLNETRIRVLECTNYIELLSVLIFKSIFDRIGV
jgi:hypothetical protein